MINRATVHATDQGGSTKALNDYSKSDAFNADKSYYLIRADSGAWFIYQTSDHSVVRGPAAGLMGENDAEWHPTDADKLLWIDNNGGLVLRQYSVTSNSSTTVKDFTATVQAIWPTAARLVTGNEGRPSMNHRYWGWLVMTSGFVPLGFMTWDKQTDTVLGTMNLGSADGPNWVGMSPTGDFFIAAWVGETIGGQPGRVRAYTQDFSDWTWVSCWIQHDDVLYGPNGHDYYVSAQTSGCDADGRYYYVDLHVDWISENYATRHKLDYGVYDDGAYNSYHINGTAYDLPGTFIVSTSECRYGTCPNDYSDRLIRYNINNSPPEILAQTYNTYAGYWSEVFGASSKDGSLVIWGGNWCASSCTDDVDAYIVSAPVTFTITTTTMANGTTGQAYQADVQTAGGTQPVTACITSAGSLPTGASWSVQGSACRLSDASADVGTHNFTLQATDSNSNTDTQAFTLTIVSALNIGTTTLPAGIQGGSYSQALSISGGTPPYACTVQSGSLPGGASLSGTGNCTISASSLTTVQTANFTIRATDDVSATDDQALSVTVSAGGAVDMMDPIIQPLATSVMVTVGAVGLDYAADCVVILRDSGGSEIDSATSASGNARRRVSFSGLTASTSYSIIATCDGATPDMTPHPFTTKPAPSGGDRTVPIQLGAPAITLTGVARCSVQYDDNPELSSPAPPEQNTNCASGGTINLTIPAGLYWYRTLWQTAADATLATSAIQPLLVE